jgi:hypothetical protein
VSSTGWRSIVHAVLVDRGRVLLVPSRVRWALPAVELDGDAEDDLSLAAHALEEQLGSAATILRYLDRAVHRDRHVLELVYELERPDPLPTPPGATWVARADLPENALAIPGHAELLDRRLREDGQPVPKPRAPWAREGWLDEASGWIEASLAGLGRPVTGRIEQLRVWCLSCLLRVPTAEGAVFFKATAASPLFVDEGSVMRGLAQLFPGSVPEPLAVDQPRRWMLLDDLGPELGWEAPTEIRELVHRRFARIQVESSARVDELLALGCIDRRPDWLAGQVEELLADDEALSKLDDVEITRLRALAPRLVAICRGLAAQGVPDALVHGDLHLGNVARIDDRYVVYDWTDACVTHPFFDLIDVFREKDEAVRTRVRDAYLSEWLAFAPMDRLLEAWAQAELMASLHHAVSYRHILASIEPGAGLELEWALPEFLRRVLAVDVESLPV